MQLIGMKSLLMPNSPESLFSPFWFTLFWPLREHRSCLWSWDSQQNQFYSCSNLKLKSPLSSLWFFSANSYEHRYCISIYHSFNHLWVFVSAEEQTQGTWSREATLVFVCSVILPKEERAVPPIKQLEVLGEFRLLHERGLSLWFHFLFSLFFFQHAAICPKSWTWNLQRLSWEHPEDLKLFLFFFQLLWWLH